MGNYCLVLGDNFEDIEAIAQIDIFRRAGIVIDVYGAGKSMIKSRSNVIYQADLVFETEQDIDTEIYDGILLPGGPGTTALLENAALINIIKKFHGSGKLLFAICAAPELLDRAGVLSGRLFTCFPDSISKIGNGTYIEEKVVVDGNIVTSRGAGTAIDAALKLVEIILSKEKSEIIAGKIIYG